MNNSEFKALIQWHRYIAEAQYVAVWYGKLVTILNQGAQP